MGGGALLATRCVVSPLAQATLFILAGICIQVRLVCNLLDGMVAIEGGKRTKSGEIFNDFPDRLADPILLISAGYASAGAFGAELGWGTALLAIMTAYVRVLGRSTGAGIHFAGPMAKQHRMAVLTSGCLLAAIATIQQRQGIVMTVTLAIILVGSVITIFRRMRLVVQDLEAKP
jgi:phosphatidylglycerophosphate synthase